MAGICNRVLHPDIDVHNDRVHIEYPRILEYVLWPRCQAETASRRGARETFKNPRSSVFGFTSGCGFAPWKEGNGAQRGWASSTICGHGGQRRSGSGPSLRPEWGNLKKEAKLLASS